MEKTLNLLLAVILILAGFGVLGAAFAHVFAWTVALLLAIYFVERKVFPILKSSIKPIRSTRAYLSYSWPLFLSTSIYSFSHYVDTIMLGLLLSGTYLVGIYNAALPVALLLLVFSSGFSRIFFPVVSSLLGEKRKEEISSLYSTTLRWIFIGTWPLFLIFFFFSGPILSFFFGSEYIIGSVALSILCLGYLIFALSNPSLNIVLASGKSKLFLLNMTIFTFFMIILNWFLIPPYNLLGAAVATSCSYALLSLLYFIEVKFLLGFSLGKTNLKKSFLAGLGALLVPYIILNLVFSIIPIWAAFLAGSIFFIMYLALLLFLKCFSKEDLTVLRAFERKFGFKPRLSSFLKKFL